MKVIIAGSRSINDYQLVCQAVNASGYQISEVVSGFCPYGVDKLGERWSMEFLGKSARLFPADWDRYGRIGPNHAGIVRNRQMAVYADAAIVVWDGSSPGSKNMIEEMENLKKPFFPMYNKASLHSFWN